MLCHCPTLAAGCPRGSHTLVSHGDGYDQLLKSEAFPQKKCAAAPRRICRLCCIWVPSEPKLDSEAQGWRFIKELGAVKQNRAKGKKALLHLSGFLRKWGSGGCILWVPTSGFPCPYHLFSFQTTPSSLGQFLLDPKKRGDILLMSSPSQGHGWEAQHGQFCAWAWCFLLCPIAMELIYS